MYIAGTSNFRDVWDDLKIPFNLTSNSQRYEQAEQVLKENPNIKTIIGHSLGGAVTLELNKNHGGNSRHTHTEAPHFKSEERRVRDTDTVATLYLYLIKGH
jgi:hypothetical protein